MVPQAFLKANRFQQTLNIYGYDEVADTQGIKNILKPLIFLKQNTIFVPGNKGTSI